jgi:hypothetical protein
MEGTNAAPADRVVGNPESAPESDRLRVVERGGEGLRLGARVGGMKEAGMRGAVGAQPSTHPRSITGRGLKRGFPFVRPIELYYPPQTRWGIGHEPLQRPVSDQGLELGFERIDLLPLERQGRAGRGR